MKKMVTIETIQKTRPTLSEVLNLGEFVPRTEAIAEAYRWGKELHAGQERLSGEPFFETHSVWIANFLDHLIGNDTWTIAALLHDTVEDRGNSPEQIREHFPGRLGEEVAHIVDGVTKLSLPREGHSREIETLRKIAMFRDPGVFMVKLADKTHNVMTLEYMPEPKRRQKAAEAIRAYGRLAGILNCYQWRRWLEDMAFPHAYPVTYATVKGTLDRDPRLELEFINDFIRQLASIMEKTGIEGSVGVIVNGYWLTWQKLRQMAQMRKTSLNSYAAINDVVSFRMVINEEDPKTCYILLADVNRFLGPYLDQDRFDDYIAYPQNGYSAIQTTAWLENRGAVEIAIATQDMENENQWGFVYALKTGKSTENYRTVEILTPTGGVRFLPEGSTVLDGIASIQQDLLLDKISAVKVNDNMARLSDKLQPGDMIEVVTEGKPIPPSEDWLSFCSKSTARLVRMVLANEALKKSAEEGRKRIKSLLMLRGILSLEDVQALQNDRINALLSMLSSPSLEDLYSAVGGEAIALDEVARAFDETGISKQVLNWTSVRLVGSGEANKPGTLAKIAGLVSSHGGNILRVVNDTLEDGGFDITLVARSLNSEQEENLYKAYKDSGIIFRVLELV
jgi:guanosine-3',5'-bis(diphosphate) 3'-pyrophosphohydrolase